MYESPKSQGDHDRDRLKEVELAAEDVYAIDPSTYKNFVAISDGIRSYHWRILDLLVATGHTDLIELILPGWSIFYTLYNIRLAQ